MGVWHGAARTHAATFAVLTSAARQPGGASTRHPRPVQVRSRARQRSPHLATKLGDNRPRAAAERVEAVLQQLGHGLGKQLAQRVGTRLALQGDGRLAAAS